MKAVRSGGPVCAVVSPGRQAVSCEIVQSEEDFLKLRGAWDRITAQARSRSPLHDWNYLWTWWEVFGRTCPKTGRKGRLHCIVIRADAEVVGIVPLFWTPRARFSPMPSRLRPLGYSGRMEPFAMTEEPMVAINPDAAEMVAREVVKAIESGLKMPEWDCAVLELYRGHDHKALGHIRRTQKRGSAYVHLPKTWKEFRAGLSKSMRDNLSYYPRLLERTGLKYDVLVSGRDLPFEEALQELIDLHKRRTWQAADRKRRDHLPGSEQLWFLRRLHAANSPGCSVSIEILCVNGIATAAQLIYDDGETLVLSYSGYDPCFAKYSPLLVLQAEIIKGAIARGVERLDLMAGSAPWQERWRPTRDFPYQKHVFVAPHPLAVARCAFYGAAKEIQVLWDKSRLRHALERSRLKIQGFTGMLEPVLMHVSRHPHLMGAVRVLHHA